jgi:hypothetical protein
MVKSNRISETDIAAYFACNLPDDKREEIERFLAEDNDTMDEFLALYHISNAVDDRSAGSAPPQLVRDAIDLLPKNEGLIDVVLGIAGNLIKVLSYGNGVDLSFYQPGFSLRNAVEATSSLIVIRKACSDVDAELYLENTGKGLCVINVLVPGFTNERIDHLRAELILGGKIIASEQLAGGKCMFDKVEPGKYSVVFRKNRKLLGDIIISITELS